MRAPFLLLLAALAGTLVPAGAPAHAQSAEERAPLDWAEARGRLIFGLDRAAWVATDDLLPRVPDIANSGLRGYVAEPEGEGFRVVFYGEGEGGPVAYYSARVENHRVVASELFRADDRRPLTPLQRRLIAARERAGSLGVRACGAPNFNTVVIPPESEGGTIDLYLLTPQLRAGAVPIGGHHRVTLAADGSTLDSRRFTNGCLVLDGGQVPQGGTPAGLMVTHLLDPIPTEIHVFANLAAGLPLAVGTVEPPRIWRIEGGRIAAPETLAAPGERRRR